LVNGLVNAGQIEAIILIFTALVSSMKFIALGYLKPSFNNIGDQYENKILTCLSFFLVAATGCGDSNDSTKLLWPRSAIDISSTKIKDYKVTASSQKDELGPQGLFASVQPGWHSASPPHYLESVTVDFKAPREVKFVDLL
jgi:hypothetical protein